jgi:hypothetical protein
VDIREAQTRLLIRRNDRGVFTMTKEGHVRHYCGLPPATASYAPQTHSATWSSSTHPQHSTTSSPNTTPGY